MSKRNDDFMEIYKRIDAFCRDAYQVEKGLTTYIDKMKEISDGSRYVSGWDLTLRRLIDYRHIRNNYAHEVGSTAMDICEEADIEWLKKFYKSLMDAQDPLAVYRKAKQPVQNKQPRKDTMLSTVPLLSSAGNKEKGIISGRTNRRIDYSISFGSDSCSTCIGSYVRVSV